MDSTFHNHVQPQAGHFVQAYSLQDKHLNAQIQHVDHNGLHCKSMQSSNRGLNSPPKEATYRLTPK